MTGAPPLALWPARPPSIVGSMTSYDVVIAGGGVAAVEAALALRDLAGDRVALTIVSPRPDFVLTPLAVGAPFGVTHAAHRPLASLGEELRATVVAAAVQRVDPERRAVALSDGGELRYDALLLAPGARRVAAYGRVLTFDAEHDPTALAGVIADLEEGYSRSVAFVVPPGVSWSLPAYELALLTARDVRAMGIDDVAITLVTPEDAPLALFGAAASEAVARLLDEAGVAVETGAYADVAGGGRIALKPGERELRAERIVALPVYEGPRLAGVPRDDHGFIVIDDHARVAGLEDVYAAGDGTTFPIKQGGIATQQADAAAALIAAKAGADVPTGPFRPVLRGRLLTGAAARYLRRDVAGGAGAGSATIEPLWWPPTKVAGRYLGPWLAARGDRDAEPPMTETIDIDVPLPADPGAAAMDLDSLGPIR
jgi:sulfide:quinone oxidoreductase